MSKKLTMTMMRLQGDMTEYRGKTPETIARRLYGKTARIVRSMDVIEDVIDIMGDVPDSVNVTLQTW